MTNKRLIKNIIYIERANFPDIYTNEQETINNSIEKWKGQIAHKHMQQTHNYKKMLNFTHNKEKYKFKLT